jgi:glutaredoxin
MVRSHPALPGTPRGCSSDVKAFLTRKGVPFESINVAANPAVMKFLATLGARSIPVVVRGQEFTCRPI